MSFIEANFDARIPDGPIGSKWQTWLDAHTLVGPGNRAGKSVIVIGTGLAGASAAASLAANGFKVKSFCFQDSPRPIARSRPGS